MNIHLNDLPTLIQGGFAPAPGVGEGWIAVDYETESGSGIGLATGCDSGAGELVLHLGVQGRYTVYLELFTQTALRVWLDGEEGYTEFVTEHGGCALQECRLGSRDLTGKRLHIAPKTGSVGRQAFLGGIRLVADEAPHQSARNLVATNDGWSWIALEGIESTRDVTRFFEPLRESDFGLMLWAPLGADVTGAHDTAIGTFLPRVTTNAFRACDRRYAQQIRDYTAAGKPQILRAAVAAARATGVDIHFYIRPEAFYAPFPHHGSFTSRFLLDHPEWRCRDEFGDEIMRMSYAFPEVQDHMLAYFEELLEYAPDGLCFAFNRSLPMMIAEAPVLETFERSCGRPPTLPEEINSEGMVAARTALMAAFLQRVRNLLNERGMQFTCIVLPDEQRNRTSGLDLHALAAAGLFDAVMIHNGGFHAGADGEKEMSFWKELQKHTRVYPNAWGGTYDQAEAARFLSRNVFEAGFDGGFVWDTENLSANPYNWEMLRRGGTRQYLASAMAGEIDPPRITPLTRVLGVKLGPYNPMGSY